MPSWTAFTLFRRCQVVRDIRHPIPQCGLDKMYRPRWPGLVNAHCQPRCNRPRRHRSSRRGLESFGVRAGPVGASPRAHAGPRLHRVSPLADDLQPEGARRPEGAPLPARRDSHSRRVGRMIDGPELDFQTRPMAATHSGSSRRDDVCSRSPARYGHDHGHRTARLRLGVRRHSTISERCPAGTVRLAFGVMNVGAEFALMWNTLVPSTSGRVPAHVHDADIADSNPNALAEVNAGWAKRRQATLTALDGRCLAATGPHI